MGGCKKGKEGLATKEERREDRERFFFWPKTTATAMNTTRTKARCVKGIQKDERTTGGGE